MFKPLGKMTVAVPGTPVQVYAGSPLLLANNVVVQALTGNAGKVYVGGAGLNKGTLAGAIAVLSAGQTLTFGVEGGSNAVNPEQLFVDADNAGEGALVTIVTA